MRVDLPGLEMKVPDDDFELYAFGQGNCLQVFRERIPEYKVPPIKFPHGLLLDNFDTLQSWTKVPNVPYGLSQPCVSVSREGI